MRQLISLTLMFISFTIGSLPLAKASAAQEQQQFVIVGDISYVQIDNTTISFSCEDWVVLHFLTETYTFHGGVCDNGRTVTDMDEKNKIQEAFMASGKESRLDIFVEGESSKSYTLKVSQRNDQATLETTIR